MRLILIALLLLCSSLHAVDPKCEGEVHPKVILLVSYTRTLLQRQSLSVQDIQFMIEGRELRNPFDAHSSLPENLDLSKGLARAIYAVRGSETAAINELRKLIGESAHREAQTEVTKQFTRPVLAPQRLAQFLKSGDPLHRKIHWHRNKEGKLSLAVYFPYERQFRLYSEQSSTPLIERAVAPETWRPHADVMTSNDFFSTKEGRLYVAGSGLFHGTYKIFIHDVENNRTYEKDFSVKPEYFHLYQNPNGDVRLLVGSEDKIYFHKLGEAIEAQGSIKVGLSNRTEKVLTNIYGRVALEIVTKYSVQLIDLHQNKIIRRYKANTEISDAKSILVGENDYAILLFAKPSLLSRESKIEYVTSNRTRPIFVSSTDQEIKAGEWHVTADGRALSSIAIGSNHGWAKLNIYEPLASSPKREWNFGLMPTLRSVITPIKTFDIPATKKVSQLEFFETSHDVLLAARGFYFRVFSLSTGAPLAETDTVIGDFRLISLEHRLIVLSRAEHLPNRPISVYDLPVKIADIQSAFNFSTPLVRDQNGDILFASDNMTMPGRMIEIFRVVKGAD